MNHIMLQKMFDSTVLYCITFTYFMKKLKTFNKLLNNNIVMLIISFIFNNIFIQIATITVFKRKP